MIETGLDPISYEVIRNRLIAITDEMRVALQSVSGSPTVTDASDFFTGLFLPEGPFISMGHGGAFSSAPLAQLVRWILADPATAVRDGDMFIANDPYIAALHQNDVQMICPIFSDGELVAWAGVMAHETDVGGMDFASWSPRAREIYQEGLRLPCVKLVDRGETREDVLRLILAASRLPAALGLDLRAFVATLNVAGDRVRELVRRYGIPQVNEAMSRMVASSERRVRERLLELPDGEFRAVDFLEHDGHADRAYRIDLRMTKSGDSLVMDFSRSSEQAPGFVNCTRPGLWGAVAATVLPVLGYDTPWNEGVLRPIDVVAPDGLIVTAIPPAPVGAATVESVWLTAGVVGTAVNKLLACSEKYRWRAQGVSFGTMATFNMGGRNRSGEWFGMHLIDPVAKGSGAFASKDGVNVGGPQDGPLTTIADVERNESVSPMLYLYRRLAPDTGGAGRMRGGAAAEIALTVRGVEGVDALIMTHGLEVPNSQGLAGGAPGSQVRQRFGRGVFPNGEFRALPTGADPSSLGGEWEELGPKPGLVPMTGEDVVALSWQGGGGFGDPLARDPEAVWADVEAGYVSPEAAESIYGVVLAAGGPDLAATEQRRRALREERAGGPVAEAPASRAGRPLGDVLSLVHDGDGWAVVCCGEPLVRGSTRWRAAAVARPFAMPRGNPPLHPDLALTAWYCPRCGTRLAIDIHCKDERPEDDVVLDLEGLPVQERP
jgi:N-methylhydantoinase B